MTIPSIIVHGGAGTIGEDQLKPSIDGVRAAAALGWKILEEGGTALDAVEQAVRLLEDDPSFDAGRGSFLNSDGRIELDALIMDGETLENGAVAAVQSIANPISLARLVMIRTNHALLVGSGAQAFADRMGIQRQPEESLLVRRELERWLEWKRTQDVEIFTPADKPGHGTVGAVAVDRSGNLAAATSTGGTQNKLAGRVGDSPLIGSGGYADNELGAASATGVGESLMKLVISKTACDLMGTGMNAMQAANEVVMRLSSERIKGSGGIITVDPSGTIGFAFNTTHLARAYVLPDGTIKAEA